MEYRPTCNELRQVWTSVYATLGLADALVNGLEEEEIANCVRFEGKQVSTKTLSTRRGQ